MVRTSHLFNIEMDIIDKCWVSNVRFFYCWCLYGAEGLIFNILKSRQINTWLYVWYSVRGLKVDVLWLRRRPFFLLNTLACIYNELGANSWNRLVNERKAIVGDNTPNIYMMTTFRGIRNDQNGHWLLRHKRSQFIITAVKLITSRKTKVDKYGFYFVYLK